MTYGDLHITTRRIARTSISDLPYRVTVFCNRVGGWAAYACREGRQPEELLGSEYGGDDWLMLDVDGHVIIDSRPTAIKAAAHRRAERAAGTTPPS